jgi:hypothetical protein
MALSTLQQLLKKSPLHSRILASLQNPHLLQSPKVNPPVNIDGRPFLFGSSKVENLTHLNPWLFSPISPVQIFSYQNLSQDGSNDDDSGMWDDSVKKKRKKKMNKHKYRKLKKRLRRRT